MSELGHGWIDGMRKLVFYPCEVNRAPIIHPCIQGSNGICSSSAMKPRQEKGRPICGRCLTCDCCGQRDAFFIALIVWASPNS